MRPRQFCRLLARQTLLGATRARLCHIVAPDNTLYVVNGQHRPFYRDDVTDVGSHQLIEQPANRGTGPAMAYALAKLKRYDPGAVVGFFPSDQHIDNVALFSRAIAGAYWAARQDPTRVVMIGAPPVRPESDYGWIVRGTWQARLSVAAQFPVHSVESFIEKPAESLAHALMANGGLWNTFIMIGRVRTFLALIASATPQLCISFTPLVSAAGLAAESSIADAVYAETPCLDFSRDILAPQPERLSVLEAPAMGWTDLGRADRMLSHLDAPAYPMRGPSAAHGLSAS